MNLLAQLKEELQTKGTNWTTLEKAQYIYLRTGEILKYDTRYIYCPDKQKKEEWLNELYNAEDISSIKFICKNWSYLYKDLLDKLLSNEEDYKKSEVIHEKNPFGSHFYVETIISDKKYNVDLTTWRDSIYIKKGLTPECFEADDYVDREMSDEEVEKEKQKIRESFMGMGYKPRNAYDEDQTGLYIQYLQLVKEELLREQGKYGRKVDLIVSNKKFFEVYKYLLKTSNFKSMGLSEFEMFMHLNLNHIFAKPKSYGVEELGVYNPKTDESEYIVTLNDGEKRHNYVFSETEDEITYKELKEPIKDYLKDYQYNRVDYDIFISKQAEPIPQRKRG